MQVPLPAGKIGIKTAQLIGLSLMVFSIFVALLINYWETQELNWPCGVLTLFIVILGIIYNNFGKYHGIFLGSIYFLQLFWIGATTYRNKTRKNKAMNNSEFLF